MLNSNKETNRQGKFDFYKKGNILGVLGGIAMIAVALLSSSETIAGTFLKYLVYLPFLFFGLYQLKNTFKTGNFMKEGMLFGIYMTFIAAVTFVIANSIAVLSGVHVAEKFSYTASSLGYVIGFQAINFFEIVGLGVILTFICLQGLKFTGVNEDANTTLLE